MRNALLLPLAAFAAGTWWGMSANAQTLNDLPELTLPDVVQADQALNAIGNRRPEWAKTYDLSVAEFAKLLRTDNSAFLDSKGRLFFVEPGSEYIPEANADLYDSAPYPLEQTFLLESRPGAPLTIYLDFDGEQLVNTAWGSGVIDALPWSRDGDRSTLNDTEKRDIQLIWRRVAEDFAPFDVNVTTRYPGEDALVRSSSSDPFFGTRVLFTPNTFYNCSCGGVAYVGTFDYIGSSYYQPALVFNSGAASAAEAASHEAGHNLGLSHDGTSTTGYYRGHGSGETGWAPIMGVGYYQPLVQWSKGEYADASTQQDDYAVINANRLPFAIDDHGDGRDTATAPQATGDGVTSSFVAAGVIETPNDLDAFSFSAGAGTLWVRADPVYLSPNLDIGVAVYDANGNLVANSNAVDTLSTSLEISVPAGQYTLVIDGVGKGDPLGTGYSDYGSLGGYRIAAQYADGSALTPPTAVIASDYSPGFAPLVVNFDGGGSIDATSHVWHFGDGTQTSGPVVSHTYNRPGDYITDLLVTNSQNLTDRATFALTVINQAPIASGGIDLTTGEAPLTVTVSDSGSRDVDGDIVTYRWDFGDGSTAQGATTSHTYTSAGNFDINLTVIDDLGAEGSTTAGTVAVSLPAMVKSLTTAEVSIAGSVFGSHLDTHVADDTAQRITESESGGKPNRRYSYAEYEWTLALPAGRSTVEILGHQTLSADKDTFLISWSTNSNMGTVGELGTTAAWISSAPFTHPAGDLTLSLRDSDRTAGNLNLDTAIIDAIVVTTDTTVDPGPGSGGDSTGGSLVLTLGDAYKVKGSNVVQLNWSGGTGVVDVLRNGSVLTTTDAGSFTDDSLGKGSTTLSYQVCLSGTAECSGVLTVAF